MVQTKQPKTTIDDLQPKDTLGGYRATWQERTLTAYAYLNPIEDQPARGFILECTYEHMQPGRRLSDKQMDQGTTLTSRVRSFMLDAMRRAGWKEIGEDDRHRPIWQHISRIASSAREDQIPAPIQQEQVSVTLDDFTFVSGKHDYQATAIQGDVQAIVRFYPSGIGDRYTLNPGVDCYPWPPAQPMTQEQYDRATLLLPGLLDQVKAALQVAGWSFVEIYEHDSSLEIWKHTSEQAAPASSVAQSRRVRASTKKKASAPALQVEQEDQAAPAAPAGQASRLLYVPAREQVKDYNRTITAKDVTYTCSRCGREVTKSVFPGATPKHCDDCKPIIQHEQMLERVKRHRAGKKGGQLQAS